GPDRRLHRRSGVALAIARYGDRLGVAALATTGSPGALGEVYGQTRDRTQIDPGGRVRASRRRGSSPGHPAAGPRHPTLVANRRSRTVTAISAGYSATYFARVVTRSGSPPTPLKSIRVGTGPDVIAITPTQSTPGLSCG